MTDRTPRIELIAAECTRLEAGGALSQMSSGRSGSVQAATVVGRVPGTNVSQGTNSAAPRTDDQHRRRLATKPLHCVEAARLIGARMVGRVESRGAWRIVVEV